MEIRYRNQTPRRVRKDILSAWAWTAAQPWGAMNALFGAVPRWRCPCCGRPEDGEYTAPAPFLEPREARYTADLVLSPYTAGLYGLARRVAFRCRRCRLVICIGWVCPGPDLYPQINIAFLVMTDGEHADV